MSKSCPHPLLVEFFKQADFVVVLFFIQSALAFGGDGTVLVPHVCFASLCAELMVLAQV